MMCRDFLFQTIREAKECEKKSSLSHENQTRGISFLLALNQNAHLARAVVRESSDSVYVAASIASTRAVVRESSDSVYAAASIASTPQPQPKQTTR